MPLRLGIGIVTYNRREVVAATLDAVQQHTKYPFTTIALADDGSTDGTPELLRARGVTTVTGRNMGIAWNKNRVLFLLAESLRCDVIVLLEDDTAPTRNNWELDWMNAALRWGHVNLAGEWLQDKFLSGIGSPADPVRSTALTAQCSAYSREALLYGGYFDSRFRGFGHEHVEHSCRLARAGYGAEQGKRPDGSTATLFMLLRGDFHIATPPSWYDREQEQRNWALAQQLMQDRSARLPWQDEQEMQQFREEIREATGSAV